MTIIVEAQRFIIFLQLMCRCRQDQERGNRIQLYLSNIHEFWPFTSDYLVAKALNALVRQILCRP